MVQTIADLFYQACAFQSPDALAYRKGGAYVPISHQELQARVERLALALEWRGLKAGEPVALICENRPEWAIVDYACAISGLPTVPLYPTLNAPQSAFILKHSEARIVFCSTADQARKALTAQGPGSALEWVVQMDGIPADSSVIPFATLMTEGEALEARRAEVRTWARQRKPDELLTLIYTSGTTGDPKGAMLTHGNLVSNVERTLQLLQLKKGDRCLSFLPLSHILERMAGHYSTMRIGASIYYAESIATVGDDLQATKPTIIISVPRIYEKIYARVREGVASSSIVKRFIFHWAMWAGDMSVPYLYEKQKIPLWIQFQLWWSRHLVFHKILAKTGGNIRFAISGGAPLAPKVMAFFWAIGLPITEGYGLTETSPVVSFNRFGEVAPGKVGRPIYDTWDGRPYVKIAADGEILVQGPNVMKGYWKNPEGTAEAFDPDGYFRTGDIGELSACGLLKITDRKKEIIVTSGGKKIAPQPIEELLKTDKFITQAVLLGDKRNFISALLIPNFDSLHRWAHQKKLTFSNNRDLVARPEVHELMMERVELINEQLSNFERVKKVAILDHELSLETGQLTPSLKVKRRVVNEMYATLIESLYKGA